MGTVDSYAATSLVPVIKPGVQTMASPTPSPREPAAPTMRSNAPPAAQEQQPPKYIIVTTQPMDPPPSPYHATMQSAAVAPITQASLQQQAPAQAPASMPSYGPPMAMAPYAPPVPGAYPMQSYPMMYPPSQQQMASQSTPPLAVAALVCGLLGWIPLWIGFILCVLAITFSCIVLSQTRSGQPGRGLAITGLVFGLVLLLPAACGL
jgi:hypothetical protein